MNISPQVFDVLQTLGYPIYVRRSLLKNTEQEKVSVSTEQKKKVVRKSSPEEVKKLAIELSARSGMPHTLQKAENINWPTFHLSLLGIHNELLVVFDVPNGTEARNPDTLKLLGNMLTRCGVTKKPSFLKEFRWPLFPRSSQIDQSMTVAEKALASVIHKAQGGGHWKWLLILGENAVSMTLHKAMDSVIGLETKYLGIHSIVSLSVEELLLEPELRKATWQHLSPLRTYYGRL